MSSRPAPLDEEEKNENGVMKISTTTEQEQERMDDARSSDGENENVRERLKKTSIANVVEAAKAGEKRSENSAETNSTAPQVDEEMGSGSEDGSASDAKDTASKNGNQTTGTRSRKRSREREDDGEPEKRSEAVGSPKKAERKRTRDTEAGPDSSNGNTATSIPSGLPPSSSSADDGHVKKKVRESPESEAKKEEVAATPAAKSAFSIPPTSGFANTSAKSPFASAAPAGNFASLFGKAKQVAPAPPPPVTPASKGGFSFGTTTASPFASVAAEGGSNPFAALAAAKGIKPEDAFKSSPFGSASPLSGGFGVAASVAPSPAFSSGTMVGGAMAFGGKVGGLGAASSLGTPSLLGKNSVFGSGGSLTPLGGSSGKGKGKAFGAPSDDEDSDDDSDDSEEENKIPKFGEEKDEPDVKVEKIAKEDKVTGEENEITVFQCRGKVYAFDKESKSWKERGLGNVRLKASIVDLNDVIASKDADAPKRKLRLIARADATYKVLLNVPLSKELANLYGDKGEEPKGINYTVVSREDGVTKTYIIKTKQSKELHKEILGAINRS